MLHPRSIRCEKCQVVMGVRHYVLKHRKGDGVPCPPVPCSVCGEPMPRHGFTAFGDPVCSTRCFSQHPDQRSHQEAVRGVRDQLRAFKRAEKLPLVYERRRAS